MPERYRLSDTERDEAIDALSQAYVDGRLDPEEFNERIDAAGRAVYAADLDPLFADLPRRRSHKAVAVPRPPVERYRPPARRVLPLLVAALVVLLAAGGGWLLVPIVLLGLASSRSCGMRSSARYRQHW